MADRNNKIIYYRLISLWVICEALLGGIIHGLKIPVSGLVVGSFAVVCISLIAWYVPAKGAIIKATIIVAIFKMMLSPQAPPPAYIAVFFQGMLGELLFWNRRFHTLSSILLAMLALLESGLQRILVLTIVYGNEFWKAINNFINGLTKQKQATNYSLLIGGGYVLLHLLTGFLVGWWASGLPGQISKWRNKKQYEISFDEIASITIPAVNKKRSRIKKGLFITWILLTGLYIQSYFEIGAPLLPSSLPLEILLRSLIIVLAWIFIIGPLLKQLLHAWLRKEQTRSREDIQEVLRLLPVTQQLIVKSWKRSAGQKGWTRISHCCKMILVNALSAHIDDAGMEQQIYILTGPIQSGKTTSLQSWSENENDVWGILTPVVEDKRVFMNVATGEQFPMEAAEEEEETISVGRFSFSKKNFDKAIGIIDEAIDKEGWLIIDEIGPLELRGEGFSEIVKKALKKRNHKVILIAREGLVEKLRSYFEIRAIVIDTPNRLPH